MVAGRCRRTGRTHKRVGVFDIEEKLSFKKELDVAGAKGRELTYGEGAGVVSKEKAKGRNRWGGRREGRRYFS